MIKQKGTDELISSTKVYDINLEINDKNVSIAVELFYSDRGGSGFDYKFLSRSKPLTDEELDELDEFIRDKYNK